MYFPKNIYLFCHYDIDDVKMVFYFYFFVTMAKMMLNNILFIYFATIAKIMQFYLFMYLFCHHG